VAEGASRWGALPLVVGGHGLGGWIALALASAPGVAAAFALAPSLAAAGPEASSPLRAAIAAAFARPPLAVRTLVLEGREREAADARAVTDWVAREPRASRLVAGGTDASVLAAPWPAAVAAWAEGEGAALREGLA
jgi:alpha-beta hydrolase superfamily lysophospholipase